MTRTFEVEVAQTLYWLVVVESEEEEGDLDLEAVIKELEAELEEGDEDKEEVDEQSDSSDIGKGDNKVDAADAGDEEDPQGAKLTEEEAAAAFMLGESIETSAGDPTKAGEPIRVVGTNPFIIGSKGEEGNRFLELIKKADVECFIINTGKVGNVNSKSIEIEHSVAILREIAKGNIEWKKDEKIGLSIPVYVQGMEIEEFYPPDYFEDYSEICGVLKEERKEYLLEFPKLAKKITETSLSM